MYQQALDLDPNHFDSLYLSSALAVQEENFELAKSLLNRAVSANPNHIDAKFNLAIVLEKFGESSNALTLYSSIILASPNHIQSLFNRSALQAKIGLLQDAAEGFKKVMELKPDFASAQKNYEQLQHAILGVNSKQAKKIDAFTHFHNEGLWLYESGRPEKAIEQFDQALALQPDSPEALHNKGMALEKIGLLEDALVCYKMVLQKNNGLAPTHNNIGNVLREVGSPHLAIQHFENALLIDPHYAEAHSNFGWTLQGIHQYAKAITCYEKALALNPNLVAARFNLGLCQLTLGDFKNGWVNYESRTEQPSYIKMQGLLAPQWFGKESLRQKIIYIYAEQGLGDTIQFCRYIELLADQGAVVLFQPQAELLNLLKDIKGVSKIIPPGQAVPYYDFHAPLMSLPLAFDTSIEKIPSNVPYINIEPEKQKFWHKKLKGIQKPKVGLVWSGGFRPDQPELWGVNRRRNIRFEEISKLQFQNCHFISLQKGLKAEEDLSLNINKLWVSNNFSNFGNEIIDFTDTAALISELDLVISVDTSTAHLVGALGKPIWILNRYDSCWRWLDSGDTSLWYPSARLYRQENPGDWSTVITTVMSDLNNLFSK